MRARCSKWGARSTARPDQYACAHPNDPGHDLLADLVIEASATKKGKSIEGYSTNNITRKISLEGIHHA